MRRNLILVILTVSLVLFFSRLGLSQTNEYGLDPVDLTIHPCLDGGDIQIDVTIHTYEPIQGFVVPLFVTSTGPANVRLDTVLTGGLADPTPPAFDPPSVVTGWSQTIVNPYGPPSFPYVFVAISFTSPLATTDPLTSLWAQLHFTVDDTGTVYFVTGVSATNQKVSMTRPDASKATINWAIQDDTVGIFHVVREVPVGPTITNCPGLQDKFVNDVISLNITATEGNTPIQGIILPDTSTYCGNDGVLTGTTGNWTFTWNTAGCPGSTGTLTFIVYDQCDKADTCVVPYKLTAAAGFIQIGCADGDPCELVEVPVLLKANVPFGGFDLYIEFDPTVLYFKGLEKGSGLPAGWEYFTYRQLPCPMCGCCKYKIQILGIYDIKNTHQGVPIEETQGYVEIAKLKFQIACDQNLRGFDANICFEFDDGVCTENAFSDVSGMILYVSDNPAFFNYTDCDTEFDGTNKVLNLMHFNLYAPPCTENPLGRPCGGVAISKNELKQRGDINLNLLTYEVADVVLFSSYFIYGTSVFTIDPPTQIANTDINADGFALSLSDFVLMLRILAHDATAIPKPTPGSDLATIYKIGDKVSTNANLGAALFVFKGDVKVSTDLKNEQGVVNNQTRVLVYMSGSGMTGQLLTAKGELVSVEAVDNFGRPVKTTVVNRAIPTAYALNANYPNPFNPTTNISFALPIDSKVSLKIYNVAGQLVRTLVNETMVAGTHTVTWDGINSNGEKVASGIYFYKLNAGDYSKTMKMVMTK